MGRDGEMRGLAGAAVVGGGSTWRFGGLHSEGVAAWGFHGTTFGELLPRHNAVDFCKEDRIFFRRRVWVKEDCEYLYSSDSLYFIFG